MRTKPQNLTGNILVVTLITMAVVSGFVALALEYTGNISRNVQRSQLTKQATNIGDAATEMAFADWRAICITKSASPAPAGKFFDTNIELPSPSPGNFPGVANYTLTNFSVVAANATWQPIADINTPPPKVMGPNPQNFSYYYIATADVVIPTVTSKNLTSQTDRGNIVAKVRRILEKHSANKTDKMIDYKDDLEMHPGPKFVATGDVHTNGDLFTGHSSLTLNGSTSFSGTWAVGFKNDQSTPNYETTHDWETPASPSWGNGLPPARQQAEVPYGVDAPDYHKLIDKNIPSSDPLYNYSFANNSNSMAQIIISDSPAPNTVKIYNENGTDITALAATGKNKSDDQLAALLKNAITTNQTIFDPREGATTPGNANVRVTTFDVGAIQAAINNGSVWKVDFSNPVIYITDISATNGYNADGTVNTGTVRRGIRLKNGGILPSTGLTIASGNPVYVQGDYNTGTNGATQPPSNSTSTPFSSPAPSPTTAGYNRAPAAIIADAVNILSNAWAANSATYDTATYSSRPASNTTVNAAIVAGIVPSKNGYYSGGVENFPRFLEDWGGKILTYYGSMIQLYTSQQAIGLWGAANVYTPPNRAWFFDKKFLSNPPPGVPYDVDYRRSRWYMQ